MTNINVTEIKVQVSDDTLVALNSAAAASASAVLADAAADRAEDARDVAISAGVTYASEAAAVAGLADGEFGGYLNEDGQPVWGQRTGSTMTPVPDQWVRLSGGTMTGPINFDLPDLTDAIKVGNGDRTIFGGSIVLLNEHTGTGNRHGFDDNTTFQGAAASAYNSFDARAQIKGTNNLDHYVGFQVDATVNLASGATLGYAAGHTYQPIIQNGTVTSTFGVSVADAALSGTGAITNQYGIFIAGLTNGTNNWAIYTAAPTKSYFGGEITCSIMNADPVYGSVFQFRTDAQLSVAPIITGGVRIGNSAEDGSSLFVCTPSLNDSFNSGFGVSGAYAGPISTIRLGAYGVQSAGGFGARMTLGTTNGNTYTDWTTLDENGRLDHNGPFGFRPAASVTPANNGDLEIEATSNTTLTFKYKGSDGTVRAGTVALS
jgi:hypothetical protein